MRSILVSDTYIFVALLFITLFTFLFVCIGLFCLLWVIYIYCMDGVLGILSGVLLLLLLS